MTALGRKEYSMPLTNVEADEEAHTVRVRQHSLPTRMTATPRPGCRSTPARVFPPGLCSASLADRPPHPIGERVRMSKLSDQQPWPL